ncbi:MAG: phosphoglycolate phosphatase [Rhodobacteraceae bacterium HLUCCA08]|nr:MAG: phosphoglycolate phosphatase [Rhodobacteraceae bacterium HLUCCA08]
MIKAVVFDKDGTLFDFQRSFGPWAGAMLRQEAQGDPARLAALAEVLRFDLEAERFRPGSIVVSATVDEIAAAMIPHLPVPDRAALIARLDAGSGAAPQVPAVPLAPFLDGLGRRGLRLGLATNDGEAPAREHLAQAGIETVFEFIAGYDSGHGAKPGPGQLLAFAAQTGLSPGDCVMVGDSTHDLHAARAAGMRAVAVASDLADRDALAALADVVLDDLAALPDWLDGPGRG